MIWLVIDFFADKTMSCLPGVSERSKLKAGAVRAPLGAVPGASLRRLEYRGPRTDPWLVSLLGVHAATLREVELRGMGHCKQLARLLAAAPHLQRITCPLVDDLDLLLQCRDLVSLELDVHVEASVAGGHALASAEYLLRAEHGLRRVALVHNDIYCEEAGQGGALIMALAAGITNDNILLRAYLIC